MHPLIQELISRGPVVTDGAWGTQLQARGLAVGEFPDAWNLSHPAEVWEVAKAYVDAGSQIILTNTFGANRFRLGADGAMPQNGLADQVVKISRVGVELSRRAAASRGVRVFASMGPSGKMLGEATPEELKLAYVEQADALAAAGADGIVVETMSDLDEAKLAVSAAHATGLPVVGCMVFDSGKDKSRTMMGVTPEQAAEGLAEVGADVIGANCGQGIAGFLPLCRRFHAVTGLPLWMKANAGLPEIVDGQAKYRATPEEFTSYVSQLVHAGANFVGGCCGTRPDFIRAIRRALA